MSTILTTSDYSHFAEVTDFHPELLCKQLYALYRIGKGTLRYQPHMGGSPDGVYLFCECAALTDAIQVEWRNGEYVPKHHRALSDLPGMSELLTRQTASEKAKNPTRFQKIAALLKAWLVPPA